MLNFYGSVCDRVRKGEEPPLCAQSPPFRRVEVGAMFSSAALKLAVDFVESLDPPPPRPKVDKAAGAGTFVRAVVEDGKVFREICHESARARDALDLTPLMEEVRT